MSRSITLICEKCGRRAPYFRSSDPSLPLWVETLSQSHCDLAGCDTGDRLIETWLDADGSARDPLPTEPRKDRTWPPTQHPRAGKSYARMATD